MRRTLPISALAAVTAFTLCLSGCGTPAPATSGTSEPEKPKADLLAYVYADRDDYVIDESFAVNEEKKAVLGTAAQLSEYKDFISAIQLADIQKLYVSALPSFKAGKAELSEQEALSLLEWLKKLTVELLPEEELDNPLTGGGWMCLLATDEAEYKITCNGRWFSVSDADGTGILQCDDSLELQKEIFALLEEKLEDAKE